MKRQWFHPNKDSTSAASGRSFAQSLPTPKDDATQISRTMIVWMPNSSQLSGSRNLAFHAPRNPMVVADRVTIRLANETASLEPLAARWDAGNDGSVPTQMGKNSHNKLGTTANMLKPTIMNSPSL